MPPDRNLEFNANDILNVIQFLANTEKRLNDMNKRIDTVVENQVHILNIIHNDTSAFNIIGLN